MPEITLPVALAAGLTQELTWRSVVKLSCIVSARQRVLALGFRLRIKRLGLRQRYRE